MTNIHTLETDTYKWETMYIFVEEGQIFMKGGRHSKRGWDGYSLMVGLIFHLGGGQKFVRGIGGDRNS